MIEVKYKKPRKENTRFVSTPLNLPPKQFPIQPFSPGIFRRRLTVRFLVSCPGTWSTELLGLASSVVSHQQGTVVRVQGLLKLVLGVLIDELLVVGDNGLGDGLTDGVDLRDVTTPRDAHADVDVRKLLETNDQERFINLEAEHLGLDKVQGLSVDLDQTFSGSAMCDSGGSFLLAEALDHLRSVFAGHIGWAKVWSSRDGRAAG